MANGMDEYTDGNTISPLLMARRQKGYGPNAEGEEDEDGDIAQPDMGSPLPITSPLAASNPDNITRPRVTNNRPRIFNQGNTPVAGTANASIPGTSAMGSPETEKQVGNILSPAEMAAQSQQAPKAPTIAGIPDRPMAKTHEGYLQEAGNLVGAEPHRGFWGSLAHGLGNAATGFAQGLKSGNLLSAVGGAIDNGINGDKYRHKQEVQQKAADLAQADQDRYRDQVENDKVYGEQIEGTLGANKNQTDIYGKELGHNEAVAGLGENARQANQNANLTKQKIALEDQPEYSPMPILDEYGNRSLGAFDPSTGKVTPSNIRLPDDINLGQGPKSIARQQAQQRMSPADLEAIAQDNAYTAYQEQYPNGEPNPDFEQAKIDAGYDNEKPPTDQYNKGVLSYIRQKMKISPTLSSEDKRSKFSQLYAKERAKLAAQQSQQSQFQGQPNTPISSPMSRRGSVADQPVRGAKPSSDNSTEAAKANYLEAIQKATNPAAKERVGQVWDKQFPGTPRPDAETSTPQGNGLYDRLRQHAKPMKVEESKPASKPVVSSPKQAKSRTEPSPPSSKPAPAPTSSAAPRSNPLMSPNPNSVMFSNLMSPVAQASQMNPVVRDILNRRLAAQQAGNPQLTQQMRQQLEQKRLQEEQQQALQYQQDLDKFNQSHNFKPSY